MEKQSHKIAERTLYISAVILTPSIPLYFLHRQNAAQGLDFNHFLIFGTILALVSLIIYFPISKFYLRRRRTMITLAAFWLFFWTYQPLWYIFYRVFPIVSRRQELFQSLFAAGLLIIVILLAFTLRRIPVNKIFANAFAVMLCVLFLFNFIPEFIAVLTDKAKTAEIIETGIEPYEVKNEFYVDSNLPKPNIYWLHMDAMMGFSGVEQLFGDSQTELKEDLTERGFTINWNSQLLVGSTYYSIAAMLAPSFYDGFLADKYVEKIKQSQSISYMGINATHAIVSEYGVSMNYLYQNNLELLQALSEAGYLIISSSDSMAKSVYTDLYLSATIIPDIVTERKIIQSNTRIIDFIDLVVEAGVLSIFHPQIRLFAGDLTSNRLQAYPVPEYPEYEDKYLIENSDSNGDMAIIVRSVKHASTLQEPLFYYRTNGAAHFIRRGTRIGEHDYGYIIGRTFVKDDNGNYYRERLENPNDLRLYLPTHRYAAKQMLAMVDTIIDNDPDAVIIIQADHGIHGFGENSVGWDSDLLIEQGYDLDDQFIMITSVISAVRIPPQYGSLTEPLDPLDISRWLVNNFVGEGNYEYLDYAQEGS